MKQKQRGSDRHKTKVKVTLKAKEIELKGKKFELEPLVEKMAPGFERVPELVSEAMGIQLTAPEIEFLLFDNEGFKKYVLETSGEEYKGHYVAFYHRGKKNIPIDVEKSAIGWSDITQMNEPDDMEFVVAIGIMSCAYHEVAHMTNDLYDKDALVKKDQLLREFYQSKKEKLDRIMEISKKEWKDTKPMEIIEFYRAPVEYWISYKHFIEMLKHRALNEGVARWAEHEVIRKRSNKRFAKALYGVPKSISVRKKIRLSFDDEYFFGYRFFEKISQMTDANVIRLAIQHNPTYVEMLYPQLYILRMKAALLI